MKFYSYLKRKSLSMGDFGFSFVESIFVLLISSIIISLAIPKLEIPVRNTIDSIKLYSKLSLNSFRKSMNVSKEFKLLEEKMNIRSYLFAAKALYMSNSIHPYSAGDLQKFTRVSGCLFSKKINRNINSRDCQKLNDNLSVTRWESENPNYWVRMYSKDTIFNIHSIPFIDNEKGVLGCFNSETGVMDIKIFKKENQKIKTLKC